MDKEAGHICSDKPEEVNVREPVHPNELGEQKLVYYPNTGEEKESTKFIRHCEPNEKVSRPILYLDYETYVQGRKRDSKTKVIEPPLHCDLLPSVIVGDIDL